MVAPDERRVPKKACRAGLFAGGSEERTVLKAYRRPRYDDRDPIVQRCCGSPRLVPISERFFRGFGESVGRRD